jgi:hypothetical protein
VTTSELFEELRKLIQGDITHNLGKATGNLTYLLESVYRGFAPAVDIVEVTTSYVASSSNSLIIADATGGNVNITLPVASSLIDITYGTSKIFYVKKADVSSNLVRILATGSDTIEGASILTLSSPLQSVLLAPDGNDWFILATNGAGGGGAAVNTIPSIGGLAPATYLDDSRYWTLGSDPLAIPSGTLALLCNPTLGAEQYDNRYFCGTRNNTAAAGGGVCFYTENAFNPIARGFELITDTGNRRQAMWLDRSMVGKWTLMVLTWNHSAGDITTRFYINGTPVYEGAVFGSSVAVGGSLCLGTSAAGVIASADGANEGWFNGMGYATRALPYEQVAELTDAVFQANQFVNIPTGGGWTGAWRVGSAEPGTSWTASFGTGALTRVGSAAGFANKYSIWG